MLWCVLLLPWLAWGHVQISGTRVIYPANAREVTLELTNKGSASAPGRMRRSPASRPNVASPCAWRTWGRGCLRIVNRYSG